MANTCGKAFGLTAFTRMHPVKTWGLRAVFLLIRASLHVPVPRGLRWTLLGKIRQVQENLTDLSFIHFARWVIVPRGGFPRLADDQPVETLHYDYLLFESNFNGDWEKYIDAFSQVVPGGMDNIWRWSVKYPKSRPIGPFLAYIRNCQYDTDYYYSAYPGASTNDVRGALKLRQELDAFAERSRDMAPGEFAAAYQAFVVSIQNCLSTTGVASYGGTRPAAEPAEPAEPAPVRLPETAAVPGVAAVAAGHAAATPS